MGTKIVLLAAILFIGVLLAWELWRYWSPDPIVTRGQLVRRLVVGVWLQCVLAMALIGEVVTLGMRPQWQMVYWAACLLFALFPMFAAIHEAGVVARQYTRRRMELIESITSRRSRGDRSAQP
jgi:hypothetical protein